MFGREKQEGPTTPQPELRLVTNRASTGNMLLEFAVSALEAAQAMVVSPGSQASRQFLERIDLLTSRVSDGISDAAIEEVRTLYLQAAQAMGAWQRQAVTEFQKEMVAAVRSMIHGARNSMDTQDDFLGDVTKVNTRLEDAQKLNDLDQLRRVLRTELQAARGLVEKQGQVVQSLRKEFEVQIGELEDRLEEVESCGSTDFLTNVANRAAFTFYLQAICRKVQLAKQQYSMAMIDLDDFKTINDSFGHDAGDAALNVAVGLLKETLGSVGFLARYGGDEFVVVYTGPASQLESRLQHLTTRLSGRRFKLTDDEPDGTKLSMSIGVVELKPTESPESVIKRADNAMYIAKKNGKGQVRRVDDSSRAA